MLLVCLSLRYTDMSIRLFRLALFISLFLHFIPPLSLSASPFFSRVVSVIRYTRPEPTWHANERTSTRERERERERENLFGSSLRVVTVCVLFRELVLFYFLFSTYSYCCAA